MPERWLGVVVSGDKITMVDAEIPDDTSPIIIQGDQSWPLQVGADRPAAYAILQQQLAGYARDNLHSPSDHKGERAFAKGNQKADLEAAELRGVVMCSLAGVTKTECLAKAHMS